MKVQQLFVHPFQDLPIVESKYDNQPVANRMATDFRQIAQKFELSFNVNIDFPRISNDMVFFRVTLVDAKRGPGSKVPIEERLPIEVRVKGFLAALAKRLTEYMNDGYQVVVGDKQRENNGHFSKYTRHKVDADSVLKMLQLHLNDNGSANRVKGPTVSWGIYFKEEEKTSREDSKHLIKLILYCQHTDFRQSKNIVVAALLSKEQKNVFMKTFKISKRDYYTRLKMQNGFSELMTRIDNTMREYSLVNQKLDIQNTVLLNVKTVIGGFVPKALSNELMEPEQFLEFSKKLNDLLREKYTK